MSFLHHSDLERLSSNYIINPMLEKHPSGYFPTSLVVFKMEKRLQSASVLEVTQP